MPGLFHATGRALSEPSAGHYRPMVMRLILGLLLALTLLAGCGEDTSDPASDTATDGSSTTSGESSSEPGGSEPETIAIVSASDAGGEVSPVATPLTDDAAVS